MPRSWPAKENSGRAEKIKRCLSAAGTQRPVLRALVGVLVAGQLSSSDVVALAGAARRPVPIIVRKTPANRTRASITQLAGGGYSAYAVGRDGAVWAWGDNLEGQLANSAIGAVGDVPTRVSGLPEARAVAASANSAFALADDGSVWAWGDDSQGELGNGREIFMSAIPVRVGGLSHIAEIVAGEFSAFAVARNGTVWAWGDNSAGQLGQHLSVGDSDVPVEVPDLWDVKELAAGTSTGYALRRNGTVWAWGDNAFGELARSTRTIGSEFPLRIAPLPPASGDRRRGGDRLRLAPGRHSTSLGRRLLWRLGDRCVPGPPVSYQLLRCAPPGAGRSPDQRPCHRGRYIHSLCPRDQRRRLVLGVRRLRAAGQRH